MVARTPPWLLALLPLLGACNMAVSETSVFSEKDAADLAPRPGLWILEDAECDFDTAAAEAQWPGCAMWLIARKPGEIMLQDGKGQRQEARYLLTRGQPPIVQILWRDEAKDDGKTFVVFFGLEPDRQSGEFTFASTWEVKCGVQSGSEIKPYPGLSPECRPLSQDAVRSAAAASRAGAEMAMRWRWLRPESVQPTISSGLKK